jgi:hypothetical protein
VGRRIRALILIAALVGVGVLAGSALSQWWEVPGATATANTVRAVTLPRGRVRVEVLNAGGRTNLAKAATDALREIGFDVVYFGNADSFDRDSSVVLDRVGSIEEARAVADALGIRSVLSEPDSNLFVDVSVVLGGDWTEPPPPPVPVAVVRPWWDLRRFLPESEPAAPAGGPPTGTMADPAGSGEGGG